jgi:hypothetical protein
MSASAKMNSADIHCIGFYEYYVQPSDEYIKKRGGHVKSRKIQVSSILNFKREKQDNVVRKRCVVTGGDKMFYIAMGHQFYDSEGNKILVPKNITKAVLFEVHRSLKKFRSPITPKTVVEKIIYRIGLLQLPDSVCLENGMVMTDLASKLINKMKITNINVNNIPDNQLIRELEILYPCEGNGKRK